MPPLCPPSTFFPLTLWTCLAGLTAPSGEMGGRHQFQSTPHFSTDNLSSPHPGSSLATAFIIFPSLHPPPPNSNPVSALFIINFILFYFLNTSYVPETKVTPTGPGHMGLLPNSFNEEVLRVPSMGQGLQETQHEPPTRCKERQYMEDTFILFYLWDFAASSLSSSSDL